MRAAREVEGLRTGRAATSTPRVAALPHARQRLTVIALVAACAVTAIVGQALDFNAVAYFGAMLVGTFLVSQAGVLTDFCSGELTDVEIAYDGLARVRRR